MVSDASGEKHRLNFIFAGNISFTSCVRSTDSIYRFDRFLLGAILYIEFRVRYETA